MAQMAGERDGHELPLAQAGVDRRAHDPRSHGVGAAVVHGDVVAALGFLAAAPGFPAAEPDDLTRHFRPRPRVGDGPHDERRADRRQQPGHEQDRGRDQEVRVLRHHVRHHRGEEVEDEASEAAIAAPTTSTLSGCSPQASG